LRDRRIPCTRRLLRRLPGVRPRAAHAGRRSDEPLDVPASGLQRPARLAAAGRDAAGLPPARRLPRAAGHLAGDSPAALAAHLGDEFLELAARPRQQLVVVGEVYVDGMAEVAQHGLADLLLLLGRERRQSDKTTLEL